jgi:putative transcriptional regulator
MEKSLLEVAHGSAKDLYDAGIMDGKTMREFDAMCLPPVNDLKPSEIKKIRIKERVSQPVFAMCLNTSPSTVKQWETGEKHPRGTSLKLLNLVAQNGLKILGLQEEAAK